MYLHNNLKDIRTRPVDCAVTEMMQPSPADSLEKSLKEKTEYVERADWQEDRYDPDLR